MTVVHIIDDVPTFREALRDRLDDSWKSLSDQVKPAIRADWKFVWSLTKAIEKQDVALGVNDVIISDIYSGGFWAEVPKPARHSSVSQLPDDPQNLVLATLEVTDRFFPLLHDTGAHLIVLTYVPGFVEHDCGYSELAADIREKLTQEGRTLIEKVDRNVENDENYTEVIETVKRLLKV